MLIVILFASPRQSGVVAASGVATLTSGQVLARGLVALLMVLGFGGAVGGLLVNKVFVQVKAVPVDY